MKFCATKIELERYYLEQKNYILNLYKNKDYPQLEKFFAPYTRAMVRSLKSYEIFLTDEEILQVYLDVLGKTGRKTLKNKIEKFWK